MLVQLVQTDEDAVRGMGLSCPLSVWSVKNVIIAIFMILLLCTDPELISKSYNGTTCDN